MAVLINVFVWTALCSLDVLVPQKMFNEHMACGIVMAAEQVILLIGSFFTGLFIVLGVPRG